MQRLYFLCHSSTHWPDSDNDAFGFDTMFYHPKKKPECFERSGDFHLLYSPPVEKEPELDQRDLEEIYIVASDGLPETLRLLQEEDGREGMTVGWTQSLRAGHAWASGYLPARTREGTQ